MRRVLILLVVCTSCASSPSSPFAPQPVDPDAIRRACAMEVSCFSNPPITPGGSCVSQFEYGLATGSGIFFGPSATDLERYVNCAKAASNCTDALNCASNHHGPDWCNAHPTPTCDGDVLVSCVGGWGIQLQDCTQLGMHCGTANGASVCTDGNTCDPTLFVHCSGSHLVSCDGTSKLESSIDCGMYFKGGTCMSTSSGDTSCYPPASASCGADSTTCDGTTAVVCAYGAQFRVECGQFASHCVVDNMGKFDCVPDASDCSASSPDSCTGDALQMCVNGRFAQTPCSSIGLSTCQTAGSSARCN